ncbi:hypothetical protein Gotur_032030 [Gossypium turneri]
MELWQKNHRMLQKIDYYGPYLGFRKKGVLVIIRKQFVYIFHRNTKSK